MTVQELILTINPVRPDPSCCPESPLSRRVAMSAHRGVCCKTRRGAARRAAQPAKASFIFGFLTGHEVVWLPEVMRVLHDELPNIDVSLASQSSPELAGALMRGKIEPRQELIVRLDRCALRLELSIIEAMPPKKLDQGFAPDPRGKEVEIQGVSVLPTRNPT